VLGMLSVSRRGLGGGGRGDDERGCGDQKFHNPLPLLPRMYASVPQ
jgi:hypothetical protein